MSHWMYCYSCISMYLVAFLCRYFLVYVQLRQNVHCPRQNVPVPLSAADLLARTVSPPKQCERCKESSASITHCILNCNNVLVLMTLESCCWPASLPLCLGAQKGECQLVFFSHMLSLLLQPV